MSTPWENRLPSWKRYEDDPVFRQLVDQCVWLFDYSQTTPSELREAVMYAAVRWDFTHLKKNLIYPSDWGIEEEVVKGTLKRIKESS